MHDLKDLTHDVHYENYRTDLIKSQKECTAITNNKQMYQKINNQSNDDTDKLLQQKDLEVKINKKIKKLIILISIK